VWVTLLYLAAFAAIAAYVVTDALRYRREKVERRIARGEMGDDADEGQRRPVPLVVPPPGAPRLPELYPTRPPSFPVTLAEVTAGVALPCGLVPLTHAPRPSAATDHVALVSTSCSAAAVRHALHAALAAAGAEVAWDGDRGLVRRGDTTAGIAVHPTPRPAFPTAPEDAVVVELWVD
jgi:hypothetical protein